MAFAKVFTQRAARLETLCFWVMTLGYVLVFCAMSLQRYDAYVMHALDMGNMEQAIWNTIHGHPFRFTNMRAHRDIEAFGTTTRLSFHVEPLLLPISLLHLLYPGPQMLLVLQTVVLASGTLPIRRMCQRHLNNSTLAILGFTLAYLLCPAMQAANLYEFHAVTLTASLLLWAFDYADQGRVLPFLLCGVLSMACKEEIGLVVAGMALWSLRRGVSWRVALPCAACAAAWSVIAVLVIVPAAQRAQHSAVDSSPYLTRYLSSSLTTPGQYAQVTVIDVLRYWFSHPDQFFGTLFNAPKRGFLQRIFAPVGYLALLNPLALAISLPSFALILLSLDQHMYSGVGHYSAELVGILTGSAILGLSWAVNFAERRHWGRDRALLTGCVLLISLSVVNARLNGFGPFTAGFEWPAITTHVRLANQMLAEIPSGAAVSAQDNLDPHLSDRAAIYLFPDTSGAEYVALDVSANPTPDNPVAEQRTVSTMLASRQWDVLFASDGLLLLHHRGSVARSVPVLPSAFYTFALPSHPAIDHPLQVTVGNQLRMLGYAISRRETVNLRVPDVILTTYWEALRPITHPLALTTYLTAVNGTLRDNFTEQAATAWLPIERWKPGQVVQVVSTSMGVAGIDPGVISTCVSVHTPGAPPLQPGPWLPFVLNSAVAASGPFHFFQGNQALCMGSISEVF